MIRLIPFLLPVVVALGMYFFSAWRTRGLLEAQSKPLDDPGLLAVAGRMAEALDLPAVRVKIYDVEPVNGLAAPDGQIYLTRGFVDRYRSGLVTAEEMGSVIAHELGHVALGHTKRRMIDVTGQNAIFVVLAALLGRFIPFVGVYVARHVANALAAGMSRKDEHEADAYASALLVRAGIGTAAQKSLFRKLDRLTGANGAEGLQWLRSHPRTADRIAAIEARERRWGC